MEWDRVRGETSVHSLLLTSRAMQNHSLTQRKTTRLLPLQAYRHLAP